MTVWEIKQIFLLADFTSNGQIDQSQWILFRDIYIEKFNNADINKNLLLNISETMT